VASVPHTNSNTGYAWRTTSNPTEISDPGWSIGALATRNVNSGTPESWSVDANTSMGLSIQAVAAAPEPSRMLLTSAGLILLIFRRKRS
ncbi:MAG: PEP-CTERM sorting domain-containing protein, partial [Planctomycetaceae bacterium]|nr:PEP-CTERM sorting domain-containing protein [Planctomycetaceae bacterium]